jgi:hypothetical protein
MPSKQAIDCVHRVFRVDDITREATRIERTRTGETVAAFVTRAISDELPQLIAAVLALGIRPAGKARPARLPMSGEGLAALKAASAKCGLDQSLLLLVSLRRAAKASLATLDKPAIKAAAKVPIGRKRKAKAAGRGRRGVR